MGFLGDAWNKIVTWATGHDNAKEKKVVANFNKVADVTSTIKTIAHTKVPSAQEEIYAAFNRLNSVKGLAEYVGTIEVSNYDTVFDQIEKTVETISTQLSDKADAIKKYQESGFLEKALSTVCMGAAKLTEGLLSVVEDLGDGVVSVIGWGAGKLGAKQFQQDCANFVKKEWSHDALNFYYKSDFAKASAFTEDSALAGGFKLVGKTAGYLYAGGVISGAAGAMGIGSGTVGTALSGVASGSTWGATAAGFLGGVGTGTEVGLNAGLEYDDAFGGGVKTGLIQGGLAFAGGKLGEKLSKNAAVKEAKANVAEAQKAVDNLTDDFVEGSFSKTAESSAKAFEAAEKLDGATDALTKVQNAKLSSFEGYSDAVTKAGQRFGASSVNTVKSGTNSLIKGVAAKKATASGAADAATKQEAAQAAKTAFKDDLKELAKENPLSQGYAGAKAIGGKVKDGVTNAYSTVKDKGLGTTVKDGVGSKVSSVKEGIKDTASSAKTAVKDGAKSFATSVKEDGLLHATKDAAVSGLKATGSTLKNVAGSAATKLGSINPAVPGVAAAGIESYMDEGMQSSVRTVINNPTTKELINTENAVIDAITSENQYKAPTSTSLPTVEPVTVEQNVSGGGNNGGNSSSNSGGYSGGYTGSITGSTTTVTPGTLPEVTTPPATTAPATTITITTPPTTAAPTTAAQVTPKTTPSTGGGSYTVYTPAATTTTVTPQASASHSGVSFDGTTMTTDTTTANDGLVSADALDLLDEIDDISIDDIDSSTSVRKIPTFDKEIKTANKNKSSNSVIPIAAGLSVAAAAGLGAKAYMDYKKNNETSEEDDEDYDEDYAEDYSDENYDEGFEAADWSGDEDTVEVDYDQPTTEDAYLQEEGFKGEEDSGYTARNTNELADIQE